MLSRVEYYTMIYRSLRGIIYQHVNLTSFKALCPADQCTIIKASAQEMGSLRAFYLCQSDTGRFYCSYRGQDVDLLGVLIRVRGGTHIEAKQCMSVIPAKYRSNDTLMWILTVLILFKLNRPGLINPARVETEYRGYLNLLKEYLISTYGEEAYFNLMILLQCADLWVKTKADKIQFDVNPITFEPVFLEAFKFVHFHTSVNYRLQGFVSSGMIWVPNDNIK